VRENALPIIRIMDLRSGKQHEIAFEEDAYGLGLVGGYEFDTPWLRFTYSSPTTPCQIFDYHMDTRERVLLKTQSVPSGHSASNYKCERIEITARGGERVPVTLLYRTDTPPSADTPLMLYGYGSYGITIPAGFRTSILSLVDRGFVYAIAHIRGSMAKGYQWYLEGKLEKKQNTFNDFVDVGRGLVERGYTSRGHIVAHGGSAGGLLVGAALNQDPELFGGVIGAVPFVDVLNTMSDAELPLTPPEWPEWGNPIEREEDYDRLLAYSPYDNIIDATYPPVLITGGLTDPRVTYWEPTKWAAKLREHQKGDAPILLKMNMGAGHAGVSGRYESLKEAAHEYAFAVSIVG
jgi:oligopeptidase B